jgi:hypothetical protein
MGGTTGIVVLAGTGVGLGGTKSDRLSCSDLAVPSSMLNLLGLVLKYPDTSPAALCANA